MLLGVIADDFTGASDIANTLAKGHGTAIPGFRTTQFLGLPSTAARPDCEAGVVALKTRSIPAEEAVAQSLAALGWLRAQGCRQIVFKYCSTFDSTPDGNIGPVAEALANALQARGVVVCPAFPGAGRTLYRGHLFVGDVPLAESSLRDHPLNPMSDSDIRRWLARQCREPVGAVSWPVVAEGADALRAGLEREAAAGRTLVVVDAIRDADLLAIGRAVAGAPLLTGGSGIALGLAGNFAELAAATAAGEPPTAVDGPEAVLAGSCSAATLRQIARHLELHPGRAVAVDALMAGAVAVDDLIAFVAGEAGNAPLVYSSADPEDVRAMQDRHGREAVAARLDALFADLARRLVEGGLRRLVVAGGETSGAVVSALGLDALDIGPEIAPGVPVLVSRRPLALALKSGNFGQEDFFDRALAAMRHPAGAR